MLASLSLTLSLKDSLSIVIIYWKLSILIGFVASVESSFLPWDHPFIKFNIIIWLVMQLNNLKCFPVQKWFQQVFIMSKIKYLYVPKWSFHINLANKDDSHFDTQWLYNHVPVICH